MIMDFMGNKISQHTFLQRRSKAGDPMPYDYMSCKKSLESVNRNTAKAKFSCISPVPPACYQMTAGRVMSFPLSTSSFHHGSPSPGG
jgi:hypothetical protein